MKQLLLQLQAGEPTLSNFVEGSNAEVLQMLRDLLGRKPGEGMVYLWGGDGCGKTHLLRACAAEAQGRYVACEAGTRFDFDADFVAVDDVGKLDEEGQIGLFHLYNRLRERKGNLVASGDAPPSRMGLREDLSTRLGWGLVYQLKPLSDEEKREALGTHAKARGFEISVEVVDYLMHHIRRDLPTLMKTLDALDEFSLRTRRPITVPLLKEVLRPENTKG